MLGIEIFFARRCSDGQLPKLVNLTASFHAQWLIRFSKRLCPHIAEFPSSCKEQCTDRVFLLHSLAAGAKPKWLGSKQWDHGRAHIPGCCYITKYQFLPFVGIPLKFTRNHQCFSIGFQLFSIGFP